MSTHTPSPDHQQVPAHIPPPDHEPTPTQSLPPDHQQALTHTYVHLITSKHPHRHFQIHTPPPDHQQALTHIPLAPDQDMFAHTLSDQHQMQACSIADGSPAYTTPLSHVTILDCPSETSCSTAPPVVDEILLDSSSSDV